MRIFNFTLVAMLGYVAVVVGAIPLANGSRASAAEDIDRRERYAPLSFNNSK
jgi:hypothetical protein